MWVENWEMVYAPCIHQRTCPINLATNHRLKLGHETNPALVALGNDLCLEMVLRISHCCFFWTSSGYIPLTTASFLLGCWQDWALLILFNFNFVQKIVLENQRAPPSPNAFSI